MIDVLRINMFNGERLLFHTESVDKFIETFCNDKKFNKRIVFGSYTVIFIDGGDNPQIEPPYIYSVLCEENIGRKQKNDDIIKMRPGHCPKCGSNNVNFGDVEFLYNSNYQDCSCEECGCRWSEIYEFSKKEILGDE